MFKSYPKRDFQNDPKWDLERLENGMLSMLSIFRHIPLCLCETHHFLFVVNYDSFERQNISYEPNKLPRYEATHFLRQSNGRQLPSLSLKLSPPLRINALHSQIQLISNPSFDAQCHIHISSSFLGGISSCCHFLLWLLNFCQLISSNSSSG